MNILICSIMRNCENVLNRYFNKVNQIVSTFPEHNYYISIYENDSTDSTPHFLRNVDLSSFKGYSIVTEKLGKSLYTSYQNGVTERIKNLAVSRNKAITGNDLYLNMDKILWIEPDVDFEMDYIYGLLNLSHADVVSGISLYPWNETHAPQFHLMTRYTDKNVNQKYKLYDTWGTRRTYQEEYGDVFTDLDVNPVREVYTTFNCIVMYNAEAFKKGARFHWYNEAINRVDCDTAIVVYNFRKLGFDKVILNQSIACIHDIQ